MGKVIMQESTSIAANSTNDNVLTGQKFERPPGNSLGKLWHTGSANGLEATLTVAASTVSDTMDVGAANRVPNDRDDVIVDEWPAGDGKLIQLRVQNTTGAALVYF